MQDLKYTNDPNDLQKFVGKTIAEISLTIDEDDIGYDGDIKSVLIVFKDGDHLNLSGSKEYHIALQISQSK